MLATVTCLVVLKPSPSAASTTLQPPNKPAVIAVVISLLHWANLLSVLLKGPLRIERVYIPTYGTS